jgi:hypothetical protein
VAAPGSVTEDTTRVPFATPLEVGVKITPIEQLDPGPKVEPQVFWERLKEFEVAIVNPEAIRLVVFEIVADCAAVDCPSFGCKKLICEGLMIMLELP